ncbi:hypothetical protein RMSM_04050 [Rhodopirellula maiorica SM1]|uniref:Uncharacterized protein n=1 Tax=Rhodopirellula maiorica SM1 TaxID=1265738 RepID=M5RUF6_9BACT|nr:hypothetical protein RMSM_04050 [Rhodopirellula maiorica SM1]
MLMFECRLCDTLAELLRILDVLSNATREKTPHRAYRVAPRLQQAAAGEKMKMSKNKVKWLRSLW